MIGTVKEMILKHYPVAKYIELLKKERLFVSSSVSDEDRLISGFTYDSRAVSEGTMFIVKGAHFKDEYLVSAFESGAAVYVSEMAVADRNEAIIVSDIRRAMPILASFFYNEPQKGLKTVGITGTKGKSTTTYYIKDILELHSKKSGTPGCGYVSSIDTYNGIEKFESHLTTPESPDVYRHLYSAASSGLGSFVMEVSSQALKYNRVDGIKFDVACYTNIGEDHISPVEHSNFEDYFTSKLKIFDNCKIACVNTDDAFANRVLEYIGTRVPVITYGSHKTDAIYCESHEKKDGKTHFKVRTPEWSDEIVLTMPGIFNISNALAAIATAYVFGIPASTVKEALYGARAGGRMQIYSSKDGEVTVIVDYAHNSMSFKALFDSTEVEYPGAKMISVFGCPGKKAHLRRRDLGQLSGQRCAHVIITEEDSGEEPFTSIASDIEKHVKAESCPYDIIEDRGEAIKRAIFLDIGPRVILLTGKGEETRQKRGTLYIPCPSDVDYTLSLLEEYDASHVTLN